jgi:predicted dehydrogenase
MHRACVERGVAVYLEKPPTLDPAELEEMISLDARARRLTNVGFNFFTQPTRREIKRRILAGEFGSVRRVSVLHLCPRADSYYARANWAAKLMLGGRLVLDSPLGNAMSHHAHNVLFWAGRGELFSWTRAEGLSAELYRARAIEGPDTVFLRGSLDGGAELRIAMSHACAERGDGREIVECDNAVITYRFFPSGFHIHFNDGREESFPADLSTFMTDNLNAYFDYLTGRADRPLTRLVDCRPFVHLNAMAYLAARRITTVAPPHDHASTNADGQRFVAIDNLARVAEKFIRTGRLPAEQEAPWACPGGAATPADLPHLQDTVRGMLPDST